MCRARKVALRHPQQMRVKVLIGDRIKALHLKKRFKLKDLALQSGVQIATLSRIESGIMSGTIEAHARIANFFEMELWELFKNVEILPIKNDTYKPT